MTIHPSLPDGTNHSTSIGNSSPVSDVSSSPLRLEVKCASIVEKAKSLVAGADHQPTNSMSSNKKFQWISTQSFAQKLIDLVELADDPEIIENILLEMDWTSERR
jgi:hypothetical protein